MPTPGSVDWKGFFSNPMTYDMPEEDFNSAYVELIRADENMSGFTPEDHMAFIDSMQEKFNPYKVPPMTPAIQEATNALMPIAGQTDQDLQVMGAQAQYAPLAAGAMEFLRQTLPIGNMSQDAFQAAAKPWVENAAPLATGLAEGLGQVEAVGTQLPLEIAQALMPPEGDSPGFIDPMAQQLEAFNNESWAALTAQAAERGESLDMVRKKAGAITQTLFGDNPNDTAPEYVYNAVTNAAMSMGPAALVSLIPGAGAPLAGIMILSQISGEQTQDVRDNTGETMDPASAIAEAGLPTALETIGFTKVFGKLPTKALAKKGLLGLLGGRLQNQVERGFTEGITELGQTIYNIDLRRREQGLPSGFDTRWTPEEYKEIVDSFAMGGIGGFALGIPGSFVTATPQETQVFEERIDKMANDVLDKTLTGGSFESGTVDLTPVVRADRETARFEAVSQLPFLSKGEQEAFVANEQPLDIEGIAKRTGQDPEEVLQAVVTAERQVEEALVEPERQLAQPTETGNEVQDAIASQIMRAADQAETEGKTELAEARRKAANQVNIVEDEHPVETAIKKKMSQLTGGAEVVLYTSGSKTAPLGVWVREGLIGIDVSASRLEAPMAIVGTMGHELTHNAQVRTPELYAASMEVAQAMPQWDRSKQELERTKGAEVNNDEIFAHMQELPDMTANLLYGLANYAELETAAKPAGRVQAVSDFFKTMFAKMLRVFGGTPNFDTMTLERMQSSLRAYPKDKRALAQGVKAIVDLMQAQPEVTQQDFATEPPVAPQEAVEEVAPAPEPQTVTEGVETGVAEVAAPEKLLAKDITEEPTVIPIGEREVTVQREGKGYRVKRMAPSGKVTANRKFSTIKEVKAYIKSVGGPKYSISPEEMRAEAGPLSPQGMMSYTTQLMAYINAKRDFGMTDDEAWQAFSDVRILENKDLGKEHVAVKDFMENFGVNLVFYKGPPWQGGLYMTQGVIFANLEYNSRELFDNTVFHEMMHDLRSRNPEVWNAVRDAVKRQFPDQWAQYYDQMLSSELYRDQLTDDNGVYLDDEVQNEVVSHIVGDNARGVWQAIAAMGAETNAPTAFKTLARWLGEFAKKFFRMLDKFITPVMDVDFHRLGDIDMNAPNELLGLEVVKAMAGMLKDGKYSTWNRAELEDLQSQMRQMSGLIDEIVAWEAMRADAGGGNITIQEGDGVTPKYSVATMPSWEHIYREEAAAAGASQQEINEAIEAMRYKAVVMGAKPQLLPISDPTEVGKKDLGPIRSNEDYLFTADLDTICTRNVVWDRYRNGVERRLGRPMTKVEKIAFMQFMQQNEVTTPCGYCYVESAREKFVNQQVRFLTAVGNAQKLAASTKKSPAAIADEVWNGATNFQKKLTAKLVRDVRDGKDPINTDPRLLVDDGYASKETAKDKRVGEILEGASKSAQGAAKSKPRQNYVAYDGQIYRMKARDIEEINNRAGLRFFSSTDFKIDHVIDLMQIVADAAVRGLKGHAYTKQIAFAEIFAPTGIKIGLSAAAKTVDGRVVEDTTHGVSWGDAQRLRAKHENVGTVMVITDDTQLEWAMEQDWIDMIIPWHASGLPAWVGRGLEGWKDYTAQQHDHGTKSGESYTFGEHRNDLATLKALATEEGATLRFHNVVLPKSGLRATEHPGYMKLVVDNVRADSPQRALKAEFDTDAFEQLVGEWQETGEEVIDEAIIDEFASDGINNADALEKAGLVAAKRNKAEQNRQAKRRLNNKLREEAVEATAMKDGEMYDGVKSTDVDLTDAQLEGLASRITENGKLFLPEGYVQKRLRRWFKATEKVEGGIMASRPIQPRYSVRIQDDVTHPWNGDQKFVTDQETFGTQYSRNNTPAWSLPDLNKWDWVVKRLQDSFVRFKRLTEVMVEAGLHVSERTDVRLAETLFHGRAMERAMRIQDKWIFPIQQALEKVNPNKKMTREQILELFDLYLHARHATERNAHIKEAYYDRKLALLNDRKNKLLDKILVTEDELANATDPAHIQLLEDKLRFLTKVRMVQIERAIETVENQPELHSGMTMATMISVQDEVEALGIKPEFKRIANELVYPMLDERLDLLLKEGLIDQKTYDEVKVYKYYVPLKGRNVRGDIDELLNEFHNFGAGNGFDIRGEELPFVVGRTEEGGINPILTQAALDALRAADRVERNKVAVALLELAEANPNKKIWEVNKQVMKRVYDKKTKTIKDVEDYWAVNEANVVAAKRDGETYYIHLYDPHLAMAMKSLGVQHLPKFFNVLRMLMRTLAQLYTTYSPEFILTNFARDYQQMIVSANTDMSKEAAKEVALNSHKAIRGILAVNFPNRFDRNEYSDAYEEMKEEGGRIGFFGLVGIDEMHQNMLNGMRTSSAARSLRAARNLGNYISMMNEATENGIRLATYVAAINDGATKRQAANLAKNITVNFNKSGDIGGAIGAGYLFFNASIQGVDRFFRSMQTPAGRKLALAYAAFGYMTSVYSRAIMGEDEDGEDLIDKISDYSDGRHWIIASPLRKGDFLQVPMPYGFGVWGQLGKELEHLMFAGDNRLEAAQSAALRMLSGLTTHFSPLGETRLGEGWYALVSPLIPTMAQPFTDAAVNENYWGGKIYPQKAPWDTRSTSARHYPAKTALDWMAIKGTHYANAWTGGDEHRGGIVDWSPDAMTYIFESFIGPTGKFFERPITLASKLKNEEHVTYNDMPIIRRFLSQTAPQYYVPGEFYDATDDIKRAYDQKKYLDEQGLSDERFMRKHGWKLNLKKRVDRVQEQIRKVRNSSPDNQETRDRILAIQRAFIIQYLNSEPK